jgi:hypothetical protein
MTALRFKTLPFVFLLACSSSQPGPGDAAPAGDAPGATDGPTEGGNTSASLPDARPDSADAALETDTAAGTDTPPADVPPGPDTQMTTEVGDTCTAPPGTFGPFPGCAATAGTACDVVCQARCGCGQSCQVVAGVPTCRDQAAPYLDKGASCQPSADRCKPGHICLEELAGNNACGSHCYRFCRTDGECQGGEKCTIQIQLGPMSSAYRACAPPAEACDPWGSARCANLTARPSPAFACYVMGNAPNQTSCECAGSLKIGSPCTFEHECEPGAECVQQQGLKTCRKICNAELVVGPNPAPCPAGQLCTPFTGSARYGFCR